MPTFTADENNSQQYFDELNKYMKKNVFCAENKFVDENFIKHGEERKKELDIQLPHVGKCYDVKRCGKPFRIAIFGSEPADQCTWNMNKKREITEEFNKKETLNPHMRGTLYTLQLLFGLELGVKNRIVRLGENEVGIFDLCCLSNGCLYRITKEDSVETAGRDKTRMERNCGEHFRKTIEKLEPQIVILQGASARHVMNLAYPVFNLELGLDTAPIETVKYKEEKEALVLSLYHPSRWQGDPMYNYGNNVEAAKKYVGCAVKKLLEEYDNMF